LKVVRRRHPHKKNRISRVHTVVSADTPPSDSVARRATFDNWRLAAGHGFKLIIARTEFQNRGNEHECALEFDPRKLEVE
jgi:hypothetical protein